MTQILHIFRKDLRRHWPEILISLVLLALFTRREFHLWQNSELTSFASISPFWFVLSGRYIPFFLVLSWIFLILRVVHGETLVGDRQWWVTKPYVWWELLLSKLFFIFIFIFVPLFHVQLLLLHHAGFSMLPNLGRLVLMQFSFLLIVIFCTLALASITKNLAQALLGIGIVVVVFAIALSLDSLFSQTAGDNPVFVDWTESLLFFGSILLVPVWQYARRRTRASRITIAAGLGAATVLSLIPFGGRVEQAYPLLTMKDSPAQLAIPPIADHPDIAPGLPSFASEVALSIPVNVSGVAPGSVVLVDRMKITVDSGEDSHWTQGWVGEYHQLWPETQRENLTYEVKRKEYEPIEVKPLHLHIQVALSEYQEVEPRTLVLPQGTFEDSHLGICRLAVFPFRSQVLECLKPFHSPGYMARFDAPNSSCGPLRKSVDKVPVNLHVAYAWEAPNDEVLPDPGLNPVANYQVGFSPINPISDAKTSFAVERSETVLCPGAEIRLAHPMFKRQFRIQLELPATRLQDLVERPTF
jgi:hypothetical protein